MKIQSLIFPTLPIVALAFIASGSVIAQDWMDDEDWGPVRKGFEFGLNFGVYQASHDPSELYGGYTAGGSSLDNFYSLGDNQVELLSIPEYFERFYTQAQSVQNALNWSSPIEVYSYPFQMRYNPSMMFGLKGTLFLYPENAIVFGVDAVSLRASGGYSLVNQNNVGNINQALEYGVFANERRYFTSIGYRTSLYISDYASWIIGLGASTTTVEIVSNSFNVENMEFQLITPIGPVVGGNPSNPNGNTRNLSNTGFGFYTLIGLEGMFEEGGNLEANFRISRDRIKLGRAEDTGEPGSTGYDKVNWNFALYITWMIPPHIGDFVRARF